MVGYVTIGLLALICALIYYVLLKFRVYKVRKQLEQDINEEKIILRALEQIEEIENLKRSKVLTRFPSIEKYLSQADELVSIGSEGVKHVKVDNLRSNKNYAACLLEEIRNDPPKEVMVAFKNCSILIRDLAIIKNPYKIYFEDLSVNFLLKTIIVVIRLALLLCPSQKHPDNRLAEKSLDVKVETSPIICVQ